MKSFKHFIKDEAPIMNTGSGIAGLPPDIPPVGGPIIRRKTQIKKKIAYKMKAVNK